VGALSLTEPHNEFLDLCASRMICTPATQEGKNWRSNMQRLSAAQSSSQELQQKMESFAQSPRDSARAKTLDAEIGHLNRLLQDREAALDQKDEPLAHDRDIRDLMGARDRSPWVATSGDDFVRAAGTSLPFFRISRNPSKMAGHGAVAARSPKAWRVLQVHWRVWLVT
jgi:hypothetical protein